MALNGTEALIVADAIGQLGGRPRVLSLAYPDLLFYPRLIGHHLPQIGRRVSLRADSEEIARAHGHHHLTEGILDSRDFFDALGADLDVVDFVDLGHAEMIVDLNQPVPASMWAKYDLILDPGTLEHVFNISQAMSNVLHLCRPGGMIFHQAAVSFINHGFYSLSPCFFIDFYVSNGFEVAQPYCWHFGGQFGVWLAPTGAVGGYMPIGHLAELGDFVRAYPVAANYLARKPADWFGPTVWPVQSKYGNPESRAAELKPWIGDVLRQLPGGIRSAS